MKTVSIVVATAVMFVFPTIGEAAWQCPSEVKEAGALLTAKTGTATKAKRPKALAAARERDVQAPRGQEVQAPRGQDVQAPRNVAKGHANVLANARRLVNEAEAACKDFDGQRALANAHAAMDLLKYLP